MDRREVFPWLPALDLIEIDRAMLYYIHIPALAWHVPTERPLVEEKPRQIRE
jgi:hypothetical protein